MAQVDDTRRNMQKIREKDRKFQNICEFSSFHYTINTHRFAYIKHYRKISRTKFLEQNYHIKKTFNQRALWRKVLLCLGVNGVAKDRVDNC